MKNTTVLIRESIDRLPSNSKICPVTALEQYCARVQPNRGEKDGIFLSITAPFEEVSVQVLAKDTLKVMTAAGIDTQKFKAHSTRMAAASAAVDKGVEVEDVMKKGRWQSWTVFEKFYNRSKSKSNFTETLFG